jgi:hypothetical protein
MRVTGKMFRPVITHSIVFFTDIHAVAFSLVRKLAQPKWPEIFQLQLQ